MDALDLVSDTIEEYSPTQIAGLIRSSADANSDIV